jgi:hypothetical protein
MNLTKKVHIIITNFIHALEMFSNNDKKIEEKNYFFGFLIIQKKSN